MYDVRFGVIRTASDRTYVCASTEHNVGDVRYRDRAILITSEINLLEKSSHRLIPSSSNGLRHRTHTFRERISERKQNFVTPDYCDDRPTRALLRKQTGSAPWEQRAEWIDDLDDRSDWSSVFQSNMTSDIDETGCNRYNVDCSFKTRFISTTIFRLLLGTY